MASLARFYETLNKHRVVGVDSSVFIYAFEQNNQFEPLCRVIFERAQAGKYHLITSAVSVAEVLVRPFQKKSIDFIEGYEAMVANLANFELVSVDYHTAKAAAQLRAEYRILLPDAIQLAAAITHQATLFITNDRALKKVRDIKVLYLKDYV